MCVCPPLRPLISSGVVQCDIDHVGLVKQVLTVFSTFQLLYMTLAVNKMDGHGFSNTGHCEC